MFWLDCDFSVLSVLLSVCLSVSECFFSVCESVLIVPVRVGFLCWCVLFPVGEKEFCVLVSVCFLCQWQVS